MALSPRDRRAVLLGGIALGVIAVYFLAIEPLAQAYEHLVTEHSRLATRVARTVLDNQKAEFFTKQLADYERTAGELLPPKPYDEQVTAIGEQIVTAAQQAAIQLKGFTPTAAMPWAEDSSLALASFHIDAQVQWPQPKQAAASWENVFKFVAGLYRIPGVLSVEQLDLTAPATPGGRGGGRRGPEGPGKGGKLAVRMTVSVLVQPARGLEDRWAQ